MANHKRIIYKNHPEFNLIQWEKKDRSFLPCEKTEIDINNDGKIEQIIRETGWLRNIDSHNIYIFKDHLDLNHPFVCEIEKRNPVLKIELTGSFYELKELSKIKLSEMNKGQLVYNSMGGMFAIHPILYKGNYYLGLTTLSQEWKGEGPDQWYVIAEITKDFKMKDLCYFEIQESIGK